MSAIEDRERAVLIDLSRAVSSADAVRLLEEYLAGAKHLMAPGTLVDINTGDLLLSHGVLSKIKMIMKRFGIGIETLYSSVPQTQQSALDEGLFVRRRPPANQKFDPEAFVNKAYKDLQLPFETIPPPVKKAVEEKPNASRQNLSFDMAPVAAPVSKPEPPVSRLSVTRDDGTREEIKPIQNLNLQTLFYKQTLRSGQLLEASGNVVVVGDAHSGSEILADGDILVWGTLGGVAHAGRSGNTQAEIRAVKIEAVQIRIANHIARRPDRLFKPDENKRRGPEVAKVKDGEIQIFEDIVER